MIHWLRLVSLMTLVGSVTTWILIARPISLPEPFPVEETRVIDFEVRGETLERMASEERLGQARDWLLYSIVSSLGLPEEDVNLILYDLPVLRHGHFEPLAEFEHGLTRSAYLGQGSVLALLPKDAEERCEKGLAEVVDRHRMALGASPRRVLVFEYEIDLDRRRAEVTRKPDRAVSELFREDWGYFERKVDDLTDLVSLLETIDDLTYATWSDDGLVLGGRRCEGTPPWRLRLEDLAALWQAQIRIGEQVETFEERWRESEESLVEDRLYSVFKPRRRRADESDEEWKAALEEVENDWLERRAELERALEDHRRRKEADWRERGLVLGTGFSLDWSYDYPQLERSVDRLAPQVTAALAQSPLAQSPMASGFDLATALQALEERDPHPLMRLTEALRIFEASGENESGVGRQLDALLDDHRFQLARYDGDLAGTEVGMVLFYTDLLAKLWSFNYLGFTQQTALPGFLPTTQVEPPTIADETWKGYSSNRIWLGARQNAYRYDPKGELYFSRNATQIFAASSRLYEPGVEAEPRPQTAAFISWWNRNFDRVAQHEPQYRRLNQIIKWSLVFRWLAETERLDVFGDLGEVEVDRSAWFPAWVRSRPELRFRDWDAVVCLESDTCRVRFYPRGFLGTTTEVLPVLDSRFEKEINEPLPLIGGVSLPSRVDPVPARINLDAWPRGAQGRFVTEPGSRRLIEVRPNRVTARTIEGAVGRGRDTVVARVRLERQVLREGDRVIFRTQQGARPLGDLEIVTSRGRRMGVVWRSRDVETAQSLARSFGRSTDPERFLLDHPSVESVFELPSKGGHLVQLRGSGRWVRLTQGNPVGGLDRGTQWVADPSKGKPIQVDLLDAASTRNPLSGHRLVLDGAGGGRPGVWRIDSARGPPGVGKPIELETAGGRVVGRFDPRSRRITIEGTELGTASGRRLGELQRLSSSELEHLSSLAQSDSVIRYRLRPNPWREVADDLARGNPGAAGRRVLSDSRHYKHHLGRHLDEGLERARRSMADGDPTTALRQIDDLIDVHGPTPELTLRRGMIQLSRRPGYGGRPWEGRWRRPLHRREEFFTEINRQLEVSGDGANLHRLARYADWRDSQLRQVVGSGEVRLVGRGEGLELSLRTSRLGPSRALARSDAIPSRAVVYIEDSAALRNLDWNASAVRSSINQAVSGKLGNLSRLSRQDIAHFRPDSLAVTRTGRTFRQVEWQKVAEGAIATYLTYEVASRVVDSQGVGSDTTDSTRVGSDTTASTPVILLTANAVGGSTDEGRGLEGDQASGPP